MLYSSTVNDPADVTNDSTAKYLQMHHGYVGTTAADTPEVTTTMEVTSTMDITTTMDMTTTMVYPPLIV